MPRPISVEAKLTVQHQPEELWPYVADTDRLDRSVGLPSAEFKRGEVGQNEPDIGEYRLWGLPIARWVENPFEWERPRRFAVVRDYSKGPLKRFYGGTELVPTDTGTTIRVFAEFEPRSWIAAPLVRRILAPQSMQRAVRQFQAIADFLANTSSQPFPQLVEQRTPANAQKLDELIAQLKMRCDKAECISLLRQLLAEAPDEDVAGMRPLDLANRHGTDPQQTLETFLHATVAGLVEMRWELLCPGCHGVKADATHLSELKETAHCSACNLDFRPDVDEVIEARFYPAPTIRSVEVGTYCVSGPAKTPNRLLQGVLQPGEAREWRLSLEPGNYTLYTPQTRGALSLQVETDGGPASMEATVESTSIVPEAAAIQAGEAAIRLTNATAHPVTVTLNQGHTSAFAATPGKLMTFPAFQSLFSAEALAPGIELQIARVGLLFTDLAGSTALYERVGDARAFRLVTDHFALLRRAIEEAGGAVIKSIGDAIMAAFPDGRSAFDAGLRIQRYILELDSRGIVDPERLVKVGVHAGACFAVTQNERLDYFGTAVNVTARAQHEARGGEMVSTIEAFDGSKDLVTDDYGVERFTVELRGISEPVELFRISKKVGD